MRHGGDGEEARSLAGRRRTLSLKAVSKAAGLINLYFSLWGLMRDP